MTCDHHPKAVTADILEGDIKGICVQWCQLCGSYRRGWFNSLGVMVYSDWREPEGVETSVEVE